MSDAEPEDPAGGTTATQGDPPVSAAGDVASAAPGRAVPSSDIHTYIGTRLREVYDDVAKQPIPDRFLELMRKLDVK